jgi:UDP-N-acetylglucosamine/UDP-N-acetylgalactosamine diphosphorylase
MMQLKENIEPLPSHRYFIGAENDDVVNVGLQAIANGEVALVVLAGGQASRLGSEVPKGMYELPLGIPGINNLFSIQAAQIRALEAHVKDFAKKDVSIPWIVLTSESTDAMTKEFMKKLEKDFSFEEGKIKFVKQSDIQCTDENGQPIKDGDKVLTAPNGNGGFFEAIQPLLPELRSMGIKYFHVYCVDNILCRIGDPAFIGQCIVKKADCAAKVIEKNDPHEKIGIIGVEAKKQPELLDAIPEDVVERYNALEQDSKLKNKSVCVIEYSEISKEQAEERDPENPEKLHFRAGSIAIHFFHIDFLSYVSHIKLPYHIAKKNIKHKSADGKKLITFGHKFERFIFDVFPYSRNFLVYEVVREEEFAPLKNSDDTGVDCPSTCVEAFKRYQKNLVL